MATDKLKISAAVLLLLGSATCASNAATETSPRRKVSPEAAKLAPLFKSGRFLDDKGSALPYRYFEPAAGKTQGGKYPVILYLHGEDEAGTDNTAQITTTECATVWVEPDHVAANPSYVLAPQAPPGRDWTSEPVYSNTLALLSQFIKNHPTADTNRVYIVGFSMGATGLWNMLLKNPRLFAAAMPISGSAENYLADYEGWAALKNTPVIILHSYDDPVVPIAAALNAAAALQAGGNVFLGYGAPTPCFWSPGSTASPHDAWWTAFHKFEVVYNSLFWGDLGATRNGAVSPTTLYSKRSLGNGITQVWDYALGTSFVIERPDKAVVVDLTMGQGNIYHYIRDNVLVNKSIDLEVFFSHQHNDHVLGLPSFVGVPQLKKVYVHKADSPAVIKLLGPDAEKIGLVKDGDLIPFGGKNIEVIEVPGHSLGSIVLKYENYLFVGDSIGTGYVGVSAVPFERYGQAVQHLLDRMGNGKYAVYGGHTGELRGALTEKYVDDMLACVKGVLNNTVAAPPYWRGGEATTRRVSTVGGSSITYTFEAVRPVKAALSGLQISPGALLHGYEPQFAGASRVTRAQGFSPTAAYYYASVEGTVNTLAITPTVRDADYRSLTVNGSAIRSGETHNASLDGANRFSIVVTAADGTTRTYTLRVVKGGR